MNKYYTPEEISSLVLQMEIIHKHYGNEFMGEIVNVIYQLQDKWIAVSERFPEPEQTVLITISKKYDNDRVIFIDTYNGDNKWNYWSSKYVLAWQPLPEPYKAPTEYK